MKKTSILAHISAAKCHKNETETVPTMQVHYYHYRITTNGELLRKYELEFDTVVEKKKVSGRWVQIARILDIGKNREKLAEIIDLWKQKLEKLNFDVEVEIYE